MIYIAPKFRRIRARIRQRIFGIFEVQNTSGRENSVTLLNDVQWWTNEVGQVKKVRVTPSRGWHPSEIDKSDGDEGKGRQCFLVNKDDHK